MLSYPLWFGDPSQLLWPPASPPPLARVTATPARASYRRICAWSPFQRAHNTSVVCHSLFWVIKPPCEYMHLHLVSLLCRPCCLLPFSLFVFESKDQISTFNNPHLEWQKREVMKPLIFILQLSSSFQHLLILLQSVAVPIWKRTLFFCKVMVKHLSLLSHGSAKQGLDVFVFDNGEVEGEEE